jgi:hypothetical protein
VSKGNIKILNVKYRGAQKYMDTLIEVIYGIFEVEPK